MSRKSRIAVTMLIAALIAFSVCVASDAVAKPSSPTLRFTIVKRTAHYDVVKRAQYRLAVKRDAHTVTVHGIGRCRVVKRTHRYIYLRPVTGRAASRLTLTSPNSGAFVAGSTTAITWRMSSAVSTGSFRVSLQSTPAGTSTSLTAVSIPANRKTTSYSVSWNVTQPAGAYRLWVYYYGSGGGTLATDVSDGTVNITAAPTPTPTMSLRQRLRRRRPHSDPTDAQPRHADRNASSDLWGTDADR